MTPLIKTAARFMAIALIAGAASMAHAQRRPDPLPLDPNRGAPDMAAFAEAYRRANEPPMIVIVGTQRWPVDGDPAGQAATGVDPAAEGRFIGRGLSLFDPAGDPAKLKSDIEEILLRNYEVELVSIDALAEADRRDIALLQQRNADRAVQLLATKVNAEVALVIRMLDTAEVRRRGARYRVFVEVLDVPRGRKIGGFAFDWMLGTDAVTVRAYAEQVTRRFIEQYAAWHSRGGDVAPRRYTVRLHGIHDVGDLLRARQVFEKLPGVSRVREGGFSGTGRDAIATLTIQHAGSLLELMHHMQQSASRELGMQVQATDGVSGTITLVAALAMRSERWRALVDDTDPGHNAAVEQLKAAYAAQGRPRVGVMINYQLQAIDRLEDDLRRQAEQLAAGGQRNLISIQMGQSLFGDPANVQPGPGDPINQAQAARDRALAALVDSRRMEDTINKRMIRLGITMVDPEQSRQRLAAATDKARQVFEENELVLLLGQAANLDIVIQGVGRIDRTTPQTTVSYTFRAVRVADSVTLAAESWSSDLPLRSGAGLEGLATEVVGAYITGRLLDQAIDSWTPAQSLTVTVTHAPTQREVLTLMAALEQNMPQIVAADFERHEGGRDGGVGIFHVRYAGTFDGFLRALNEQQEKLPFKLTDTGATRQTLTLRLDEPAP